MPGLEVYERAKSGTEHQVGSGNRAIRPGDDIELRRNDLVDILHRSAQHNFIYKFSNRITHLVQDTDKVKITFADQITATFDFVVGADGIYSAVRKLTFGEEQQFTYFLNYYFSVFEVNAGPGEKNYGHMYNTPDNMATVYFYNADSADAILAFRAPGKIVFDRYNIQEQK